MSEFFNFLERMPNWFILVIVMIISAMLVYLTHKKVSIRIGSLAIEQEKALITKSSEDNVRLKIHAQIREYENFIGLIQRNIFEAIEKTFPTMTREEKYMAKLLCTIIRRTLEKQLILDLVANHIATKSEEELREYTKDKSLGYSNRIANAISEFNGEMFPEKDLNKVIANINLNELENIYFNIYKNAVKIVKG